MDSQFVLISDDYLKDVIKFDDSFFRQTIFDLIRHEDTERMFEHIVRYIVVEKNKPGFFLHNNACIFSIVYHEIANFQKVKNLFNIIFSYYDSPELKKLLGNRITYITLKKFLYGVYGMIDENLDEIINLLLDHACIENLEKTFKSHVFLYMYFNCNGHNADLNTVLRILILHNKPMTFKNYHSLFESAIYNDCNIKIIEFLYCKTMKLTKNHKFYTRFAILTYYILDFPYRPDIDNQTINNLIKLSCKYENQESIRDSCLCNTYITNDILSSMYRLKKKTLYNLIDFIGKITPNLMFLKCMSKCQTLGAIWITDYSINEKYDILKFLYDFFTKMLNIVEIENDVKKIKEDFTKTFNKVLELGFIKVCLHASSSNRYFRKCVKWMCEINSNLYFDKETDTYYIKTAIDRYIEANDKESLEKHTNIRLHENGECIICANENVPLIEIKCYDKTEHKMCTSCFRQMVMYGKTIRCPFCTKVTKLFK